MRPHTIKKLVPTGQVAKLEKILGAIQRPLLAVAGLFRFFGSVYYALCSRAFGQEHRAVIHGRLTFMKASRAPRANQYVIRRNIHRLEKGLLMRPRRDLFALDYIAETVRHFQREVEAQRTPSPEVPDSELQWASDVLAKYFEVVGSHPIVDSCRSRFRPLDTGSRSPSPPAIPYPRDVTRPPPVTYEELLSLARRRKSVRWFLPKPVPRALIDQAMAVAALSPSACNRQPFEFRFFDEPDLVQRLASIPMGTEGFGHNFPAIAVIVGKLRAFYSERDRHLIYIDAALAAMAFTFALETLELASCYLNWPELGFMERQMAQLLKLAPDERPIMLMALGYPDPEGLVTCSARKPLAELRRFNT